MRKLVCFVPIISVLFTSSAGEPFRQTLTSVERGVHLNSWQLTARDLDPNMSAQWTIRKRTLHGGKQEGVDVITVD